MGFEVLQQREMYEWKSRTVLLSLGHFRLTMNFLTFNFDGFNRVAIHPPGCLRDIELEADSVK